jgi:hypothetical protein
LTLLGAVVAVAGSSLFAYFSRVAPARDIRVAPTSLHFGRVKQKQVLSGQFRITNASGATVRIARIIKSCDCSRPDLDRTVLQPGEQAVLRVLWDVGTRHGRSETMLRLATISDGRQSGFHITDLKLVADVLADFALAPESIVFRRSGGNQQRTVQFRPTGGDAKLLAVQPTHLSLAARISENQRGFTVWFDADKWPSDRDRAEVLVETSSGVEPQRVVPVRVE